MNEELSLEGFSIFSGEGGAEINVAAKQKNPTTVGDTIPRRKHFPKWDLEYYVHSPYTPGGDLEEHGFGPRVMVALAFIKSLYDETHKKGLSLLITVDGRHRSGKSRLWATIGCILSPVFKAKMKERIVSSADELHRVIRDIQENREQCPFIMVDEAGASLNAGDWFEKMQKAIIKALTVIGYLHPTIVFISTNKDLILSGVRKQAHLYVKCVRSGESHATMIPYYLNHNPISGKTFYKKPKIRLYGETVTLNAIQYTKPPEEVEEVYKGIELEMKPRLLQSIYEDVTNAAIKKAKEVPDFNKMAELTIQHKEFFTKKGKEDEVKLDEDLIRAKFKLSVKDSKTVKKLAAKMEELDDEATRSFFGKD